MLTTAEFHDALRRMMIGWRQDNSADAVAAVNLVLSQGSLEMKAKFLFYQGTIKEEKGDPEAAWNSWSDGLQYARDGSFVRFQLELMLGNVCERQGRAREALEWFRKALETCCSGDEFAGNKALSGYLRLTNGKPQPEDESIIACVAQKSWRVLELPGAPDANDWTITVARLEEELQNKAEEIVNASESDN